MKTVTFLLVAFFNIQLCNGICDVFSCYENIDIDGLLNQEYELFCQQVDSAITCLNDKIQHPDCDAETVNITKQNIDNYRTGKDLYCAAKCNQAKLYECVNVYSDSMNSANFSGDSILQMQSEAFEQMCGNLNVATTCFKGLKDKCDVAAELKAIDDYINSVEIVISAYCGKCSAPNQVKCTEKMLNLIPDQATSDVDLTQICPSIDETIRCLEDMLPSCLGEIKVGLQTQLQSVKTQEQAFCSTDGCGVMEVNECVYPHLDKLNVEEDTFNQISEAEKSELCSRGKQVQQCLQKISDKCKESENFAVIEKQIENMPSSLPACDAILENPCNIAHGLQCVRNFQWKKIFTHPVETCKDYQTALECVDSAFETCNDGSSVRIDVFGLEIDRQAMGQICDASGECSVTTIEACTVSRNSLEEKILLGQNYQCTGLSELEECLGGLSQNCDNPLLSSLKKFRQEKSASLDDKCSECSQKTVESCIEKQQIFELKDDSDEKVYCDALVNLKECVNEIPADCKNPAVAALKQKIASSDNLVQDNNKCGEIFIGASINSANLLSPSAVLFFLLILFISRNSLYFV